MKKSLLAVSIVLLGGTLRAQAVKVTHSVGIETDKPRATLDVAGDVRIQSAPQYQKGQTTKDAEIYDDCPCELIIDKNGVLKRKPLSQTKPPLPHLVNGYDINNLPEGYVKDRNFGDWDHDFIYKVITGPDGKKWLNNNLGADYANIHSPYFDPNKQATSREDYRAYGSLFQWQRKADGHELITWKNSSNYINNAGKPKNGTTSKRSPSYEDTVSSLFITENTWTSATSPVTLWQANGSTNPCPEGFHVPTKAEWATYHQEVTDSSTKLSNDRFYDEFGKKDFLRLTVAGDRLYSLDRQGLDGGYWSSENNGSKAWIFTFYFRGGSYPENSRGQGFGQSVRCIQD